MFWLLTHANEGRRATNTGHHVQDALGPGARTLVWRRAVPDPDLLAAISRGGVALAWPSPAPAANTASASPSGVPPTDVVILDGTWQEARKIYNRSAYLHDLPRLTLNPTAASRYTQRRNQVDGGLCTLEAAAAVVTELGWAPQAAALNARVAAVLGDAAEANEPAQ